VSALDAHGPELRAGLSGEPDVVSPNEREAEEIVGHEFHDDEDLLAGVLALADMGPRTALIHGSDGCIAAFEENGRRGARVLRARLSLRDVVSTVGSGDAFLAGFVSGVYRGTEPEHTLALAVACGAANTQRLGAGILDPADVEAYMRQVEVVPATPA
jgi:fructose-1-phosphate kinase PfkB-like protein